VATETRTHTAVCPAHGTVEATREMPKPGWPYLVYAVRRHSRRGDPTAAPLAGKPSRL